MIPGTFPDTFFKMATDIIFHRFWVDFRLHFGMLFGVKVRKNGYKKTQQKHTCKKVTRPIPSDPGLDPVVP